MSSILKALKKIEADPLVNDENFVLKDAGKGSDGAFNTKATIFILSCILLIGLICIYVFKDYITGNRTDTEANIGAISGTITFPKQKQTIKIPVLEKPAEEPPAAAKADAPKQTQKEVEEEDGSADENTESYPEITDKDWLKLDAISWNRKAENRIAVISGNIVYEGGTVKDGVVYRINRTDVVIKSGSKMWKLKFREPE